MTISDFYPGTTKRFTVTILLNGVMADISLDTVIWRIKTAKDDTDAEAVLSKVADVSNGANGIAIFELTPAETGAITAGHYYTDITWITAAGAEYVIYDSMLRIKDRVSDV